uniref:Vesicle-fusing ATPase n=1 Tax=Compsopogon caeruleus TaxID=31354 RepID=A0A7S1TDX2_9RHOD|mmetsp:Transcript_16056/g.32323  ORF Transcript_16056/g.32323 Transcript_16056/m.32323 type:complete len:764 (+) Transcript_16056:1050-3341(+)
MSSWFGSGVGAGGKGLKLRATGCPSNSLALTNRVFLSMEAMAELGLRSNPGLVELNGSFVYVVVDDPAVPRGSIGLNSMQRKELRIPLDSELQVEVMDPSSGVRRGRGATALEGAVGVTLEVDFVTRRGHVMDIEAKELEGEVQRRMDGAVPSVGQGFLLDFFGTTLVLKVSSILTERGDASRARFNAQVTKSYFVKAAGCTITIKGADRSRPKEIFKSDFNFEKMGIGGLDREFAQIFRRAFASRVFPPEVIAKLGINHVRGMLLYGPPGTGKTLIARQIGKLLNAKEPKVVNGPEVLNKYVGQSEENVRKLFEEAEKEYGERGEDSDLHIIIFDEIDAICKQRGTRNDGTGVGDTVVNQLLSKIDGVNSLNNILVIGMTNRKDLIDEALLRPGRLEVHVEISLPDEAGRVQILRIHTSKMRSNNMLAVDFDENYLAGRTQNYSGAELEGVCRSAAAFALNRHVNPNDLSKKLDPSGMTVCLDDFKEALKEVPPAFGIGKDDFRRCLLGGFITHGQRMKNLLVSGQAFREEVRNSNRNPLLSVLIEGPPGTGKTALAARLAVESGFPFVRFVSPEHFVGYSEVSKVQALAKIFDDAYKSSLSVIVLDSIERMIDYAPIGPRFSNMVLQSLLILMKQIPPMDRRLLILATTSSADVIDALDIRPSFNAVLSTPVLNRDEISTVLDGNGDHCVLGTSEAGETCMLPSPVAPIHFKSTSDREGAIEALYAHSLGIKKLLMILEMAKSDDNTLSSQRLSSVLLDST